MSSLDAPGGAGPGGEGWWRRAHLYRWALLALVAVAAGAVALALTRAPASTDLSGGTASLLPAEQRPAAPELTGIRGWINSPPLRLASLRGDVVLIDFWTFSCVNCVRTFPALHRLVDSHRGERFVLIGVHSPEFDFEKDPSNVAGAVRRDGVTWPVALDPDMATWGAYSNQYWPAEYLVDPQGRIAAVRVGEGGEAETARDVDVLLGHAVSQATPSTTAPATDITPELYAGSDRGTLDDQEGYGTPGQRLDYVDRPPPAASGRIQVVGGWVDEGQDLLAATAGHVRLRFRARDLFIVAGSRSGVPLTVTVTVDGQPVPAGWSGSALHQGALSVTGADLYPVLHLPAEGDHLIDLAVPAGLRLFTFTFG